MHLIPFSVDHFDTLCSWAPSRNDVLLFSGDDSNWPLTDGILSRWLHAEGTIAWTGVLKGAPNSPVGHIELVRTGDSSGRLARVILDPQMRGRKLGRALVAAAMDASRAEGVSLLSLNVITGNTAAIQTYVALGFTHRGTNLVHPNMVVMETALTPVPLADQGRQ